MYQDIEYQVNDRIAVISINRPKVLNAIRVQTYKDIIAALQSADADDAVSVIVMTGAEGKFTAGNDLRDLLTDGDLEGRLDDGRLDARVAHEGAVAAVEVADPDPIGQERELDVEARDRPLGHDEVRLRVTADHQGPGLEERLLTARGAGDHAHQHASEHHVATGAGGEDARLGRADHRRLRSPSPRRARAAHPRALAPPAAQPPSSRSTGTDPGPMSGVVGAAA